MSTANIPTASYSASVDDWDSKIVYSSGWDTVTRQTSNGHGMATLHSSATPGSTATFTFDGTRVAISCLIPAGSGLFSTASFRIDGEAAVTRSHPSTVKDQWHKVCWSSQSLSSGTHTVTITAGDDGASFFLDAINFEPIAPAPLSLSTTPTFTTTGSETIFSSSTFSSSSAASSSTLSPFPATSGVTLPMDTSFSAVAPILGVAIGAILLFILLVYFFLRRIRKHSNLRRLEEATLPDELFEPRAKRPMSMQSNYNQPFTLKELHLGFSFADAIPHTYSYTGRENVASQRAHHREIISPSPRATRHNIPCSVSLPSSPCAKNNGFTYNTRRSSVHLGDITHINLPHTAYSRA